MKAVVWTDFFQGFIMFGGLLIVLIVVSFMWKWLWKWRFSVQTVREFSFTLPDHRRHRYMFQDESFTIFDHLLCTSKGTFFLHFRVVLKWAAWPKSGKSVMPVDASNSSSKGSSWSNVYNLHQFGTSRHVLASNVFSSQYESGPYYTSDVLDSSGWWRSHCSGSQWLQADYGTALFLTSHCPVGCIVSIGSISLLQDSFWFVTCHHCI